MFHSFVPGTLIALMLTSGSTGLQSPLPMGSLSVQNFVPQTVAHDGSRSRIEKKMDLVMPQELKTCNNVGEFIQDKLPYLFPTYSTETSPKSQHCKMTIGDVNYYYGKPVSLLQITLMKCYGESLVVDGLFGNGTASALARVQSRLGVTSDGVFGPATHERMAYPTFRGGEMYADNVINCRV